MDGLYRVRIEPTSNQVSYKVKVIDMQFYSIEAVEPRYNFYVRGRDNNPDEPDPVTPMEQYFWIPELPTGQKVRVRLQTDKAAEKAKLEIYKVGTPDELITTLEIRGTNQPPGTAGAYFATTEFDPAATSGSGAMYKFKLTDPFESLEQAEGNIWVRFSRNVPHYFANDYRRLIVPIVQREFDPVLYVSPPDPQPPNQRIYRAYLCAERSTGGIGSNKLKVQVGTTSSETTTGYNVSVTYNAPQTRTKLSNPDSDVFAQFLDSGTGAVIAKSTDKVNTIYIVQEPTWEAWTNPLYIMYDDKNGFDNMEIAVSNYKTVQCNDSTAFSNYFSSSIQAMGVLYSGNMLTKVFTPTPNHPNIRFWKLLDEPDGGPLNKLLKEVYDLYYDRKNNSPPPTKPLSVNLALPFSMEEYAEGCDIVSTDPYVITTSSNDIRKINEWKDEAKRVAGTNKKVIVVLWAWSPVEGPGSIIRPKSLYGQEWSLLKNDTSIHGIATFKWGRNGVQFTKLTAFPAGDSLWEGVPAGSDTASIRMNWDEFRP